MVGSGQRGLPVCLHIRHVPAHWAQVFEPRGGRGLLIDGCKCPAGSRKGMCTLGRHRAPGPLRGPWKIPRPGPRYPSLSLAHCLCRAESAAGQCGLGEMARSSEWQGGLLFPQTGAQGPCETAVTSKGGSPDPSRVGQVTSQGWVTRPRKGGSRDPKRVGQETPQGWVT